MNISIFDESKSILEQLSFAGTIAASIGVIFAYFQLKLTKEASIAQFENQLFSEYRRIISNIPYSALLGVDLSDEEIEGLADDFYMYIDLTNEQITIRMAGKITQDTWENWRDGIKSNLLLPSFKKSWENIKKSSSNFQELRRLENEGFMSDPVTWNSHGKTSCLKKWLTGRCN